MKLLNKLLNLTLMLVVAGCASTSSVKQFYESDPNLNQTLSNLEPWSGELKILQVSEPSEEWKNAERNSYKLFGRSRFYGASSYDPVPDIRKHGTEIEADLAIWVKSFKDTVTGTMPTYAWVPGTTSTTTASGNVNSNASGYLSGLGGNTYLNLDGNSQISGQSTTTTSGRMVPTGTQSYSVERSNYYVGFYRKHKKNRLGISWNELSDEMKKKLETNSGIVIRIIKRNSPAFDADLLEGDIIMEMNNSKVSYSNLLDLISNSGNEATFKIIRNDKEIEKKVVLPSP
jgi:serine protease Do